MITKVDERTEEQAEERAVVRPRPAPSSRKRPSLTGRAAVLAAVSAILLVALAVPVRSWFAQRAQVSQLRADVASARERVAALKIEADRWNDPNFVAAQARQRLHYVLPGEVGYITMGGVAGPESAAAAAEADQPWFTSMWESVQQADGSSPDAKATGGKATDVTTIDGKATDGKTTDAKAGPVGKTGTREPAQ